MQFARAARTWNVSIILRARVSACWSTRTLDYSWCRLPELCPYSGLLGSLEIHWIHSHASFHKRCWFFLHFFFVQVDSQCSVLDHGFLAIGHGTFSSCSQHVWPDHGVFAVGPSPLVTYKTGVLTATWVSQLDHGDLAVGYDEHRGELAARRICSACSSSCYVVCLHHGGFVGVKVVNTASVQVLISALSLQRVFRQSNRPVLCPVAQERCCTRQVCSQQLKPGLSAVRIDA